MMAELETISIPARNKPSAAVHPSAEPHNRTPNSTPTAASPAATTKDQPNRCNRPRLRFKPIEKIKNTSPSCARVSTRSKSETNAKGGVNGPIIIPATRYPTTTDNPRR
jgi:hypothetical protein